MIISNLASRLLRPFANAGAKATIPLSQTDATRASYEQGFPALNMTPIAAGGVPPSGQDFNGILYDLSNAVMWQQAAGILPWSAEFAQSPVSSGYPKNALVVHNAVLYQSSVDNNTETPGAGTNWQGVGVSNASQPKHAVTLGQMQDLIPPAGSILITAANLPPAGYLRANGAAVSRTAYAELFAAVGTTYAAGDGSTTFNLPDLRGEFIRGFDGGRGVDSGRQIGSFQSDAIGAHSHAYKVSDVSTGSGGVINPISNDSGTYVKTTNFTGGNETRPRNVALMMCIKY